MISILIFYTKVMLCPNLKIKSRPQSLPFLNIQISIIILMWRSKVRQFQKRAKCETEGKVIFLKITIFLILKNLYEELLKRKAVGISFVILFSMLLLSMQLSNWTIKISSQKVKFLHMIFYYTITKMYMPHIDPAHMWSPWPSASLQDDRECS